ncbi:Sporulation lipoprotein YhcN/YlaJ-like [Syntrophomonas zehnderi OL-4]|uniref:Sporulation lipoprotein YhcN/YlaJ-like n=1 Tax=Syntrophomonas zehnderi OL-4 TaxID=690567 RepID=A0A0E4G981_9FIRM|nr:YhcN/YlaJ family sporulation lipoprotein [Syntrophomonas zehnderi]CFX09622.1 Sporulation lipoprotein YhcN/YlaJ-like [Syntrophomonas zehnderi OL-4]
MRKKYSSLIILLAGVLLLGGCQQAKKPVPPDTAPAPRQVTESDERVLANRFSSLAKEVNGVNQATVVVAMADASLGLGKTTPDKNDTDKSLEEAKHHPGKMVVMVGLTLNDHAMGNERRQQNVKNAVKKRILKSDEKVSDVLVTTDPNMVKKINDVAAGLLEGKPILSYAKSASELGKAMKGKVK